LVRWIEVIERHLPVIADGDVFAPGGQDIAIGDVARAR